MIEEKECSICNNKRGKLTNEYCEDNPKHPTYEERYDPWDGLTYLDCWRFIRFNETKEEYKERMRERELDKSKIQSD
tara:strand:- start:248 stop:478 length:231 start_codon:yes stop_codon:yes gene_type:complete